jgi:hypothetical protein
MAKEEFRGKNGGNRRSDGREQAIDLTKYENMKGIDLFMFGRMIQLNYQRQNIIATGRGNSVSMLSFNYTPAKDDYFKAVWALYSKNLQFLFSLAFFIIIEVFTIIADIIVFIDGERNFLYFLLPFFFSGAYYFYVCIPACY